MRQASLVFTDWGASPDGVRSNPQRSCKKEIAHGIEQSETKETKVSRLIFNSLPDAQDLLALSRPELAAHVLEHLRAVGSNPLKQQYSHPDNLAISIKEKYPLPFRDKVHKAIFSACEWLRTNGYLIETNNQGFFEIAEEGNRIDVAINRSAVRGVPIGATKADAPPELIPRL